MAKIIASQIEELERICPNGVIRNVDLSSISQWKIGGHADIILRPSSTLELSNLRKWLFENQIHSITIGLTSNLLFPDEGVTAPILQIGPRMGQVKIHNEAITAQAGVWIPYLARLIMKAGLTGAEHICGIPGTLGGLICMNGGSQRRGIGENAVQIESVNSAGEIIYRNFSECDFSYRKSIYLKNDESISCATLSFKRGSIIETRARMLKIYSERRRKFPRKLPNCGSVFKSNPEMYDQIGPPGAIIERLGLKGHRTGGAEISSHHANFIVNTGGAKARDVLSLITETSRAVKASTGYQLEAEALYVTSNGKIIPADEVLLG